jgi:hypothetical protein
MHSSLHQAMADLSRRTPMLLMIVAVVVFVLGYAAYLQFLEPYGLGPWTKFLAASVSLAVSVMYWLFFSYLLEVVALLPRAERAKINPIILLMTVFILASSSYPHVQKMGGGFAAELEDKEYIEEVVGRGERVKAGVRQVDQLGGLMTAGAIALRDLEEREKRGLLSGFDSSSAKPGPVSDWIGGFAARLEGAAGGIPNTQKAASEIITRIDAAANAMRQAIQDSGREMAARRASMQAAGDAFRSALIDLGQTLPVASMVALASGLQGEIAEPALSSVPHVREGQRTAIERVKGELARWGKAIEAAVAPIATATTAEIPPYNPAPIPILVIKHAFKLLNIIGVAIAVDLLGLGLYFFTARVNDAIRRRPEEEMKALTVADLERAQEAEALLRAKRARGDFGLIEPSAQKPWLKHGDDQGGVR